MLPMSGAREDDFRAPVGFPPIRGSWIPSRIRPPSIGTLHECDGAGTGRSRCGPPVGRGAHQRTCCVLTHGDLGSHHSGRVAIQRRDSLIAFDDTHEANTQPGDRRPPPHRVRRGWRCGASPGAHASWCLGKGRTRRSCSRADAQTRPGLTVSGTASAFPGHSLGTGTGDHRAARFSAADRFPDRDRSL